MTKKYGPVQQRLKWRAISLKYEFRSVEFEIFNICNGEEALIKGKYDSIVIGAGFFGLSLARHLSVNHNQKVLVIEKSSSSMQAASYNNQARVHNGYHYPRNLLTAKRSRVLYPRFIKDYKEAIYDEFDKYYAIGTPLGKVSSGQFYNFCKTIGAPIEVASPNIKKYFNSRFIEEVFFTQEVAFDSNKLKNLILNRIDSRMVEIIYNTEATKVFREACLLGLHTKQKLYVAKNVFNCTYAQLNLLLNNSQLPLISLKHEMTEVCIVDLPVELKKIGITVMCGPFFSTMPFPSVNAHSFSHVRYTPHGVYFENKNSYISPSEMQTHWKLSSNWKKMVKDAQRFIPVLSEAQYKNSLWQIKTILPQNESNDGRPILYKSNYNLQGLHCILGGKIDNVYDMTRITDNIIHGENLNES